MVTFFSRLLFLKRLILRAGLAVALITQISSSANSSASNSFALAIGATNTALKNLVDLVERGPQTDTVFLDAVATCVRHITTATNDAVSAVQPFILQYIWEDVAPNYPEFSAFLLDQNKTIKELLAIPNSLIISNQNSIPHTCADLEYLYVIGEWANLDLDITACTNLKALGFFDGTTGLDGTQRTQISTLVRNTNVLQDLIVMDWGDSDIGTNYFSGATSLRKAVLHRATKVCGGAFYGCSSLVTALLPHVVTIEENIDNPANGAFRSCTVLSTIHCPGLTNIGAYAFDSCNALTEISWPSVTSVGKRAFYNCTYLRTVSLPGLLSIGTSGFNSCRDLASISIPNVTYIGNYGLSQCSFSNISCPALLEVGAGAFATQSKLKAILFPALASAGDQAFIGQNLGTAICLPSLTTSGPRTFGSCRRLLVAYLPVHPSFVLDMFDSCSNLRMVIMPGVTWTDRIFKDCPALGSHTVVAPGTYPEFEKFLKEGHAIRANEALGFTERDCEFCCNVTSLTNFNWYQFKNLYLLGNLEPADLRLETRSGLLTLGLFDGGALTLTQREAVCTARDRLVNVYIGNWGANMEHYLTWPPIKDVMIGGITIVPDGPFRGTGIETASFPDAKMVEVMAFYSCKLLTKISLPLVTFISASGFEECTSLPYASFPVLEEMESGAFYGCSSLQTIIFPQSVVPGENAFAGCPSSLQILNP